MLMNNRGLRPERDFTLKNWLTQMTVHAHDDTAVRARQIGVLTWRTKLMLAFASLAAGRKGSRAYRRASHRLLEDLSPQDKL
ncbi:MAG: hypothetical protein FRX49_02025 [Trebouxia sp. A1-2]|nr:MAG: hypothetical protein FRX49_02025 [Trebouxia sp. A1-2]